MSKTSANFVAFKWWKIPGYNTAVWVVQKGWKDPNDIAEIQYEIQLPESDWSTVMIALLEIEPGNMFESCKNMNKRIWLNRNYIEYCKNNKPRSLNRIMKLVNVPQKFELAGIFINRDDSSYAKPANEKNASTTIKVIINLQKAGIEEEVIKTKNQLVNAKVTGENNYARQLTGPLSGQFWWCPVNSLMLEQDVETINKN